MKTCKQCERKLLQTTSPRHSHASKFNNRLFINKPNTSDEQWMDQVYVRTEEPQWGKD